MRRRQARHKRGSDPASASDDIDDLTAFSRLVLRFQDLAYATAYGWLGRCDQAEEVVQWERALDDTTPLSHMHHLAFALLMLVYWALVRRARRISVPVAIRTA